MCCSCVLRIPVACLQACLCDVLILFTWFAFAFVQVASYSRMLLLTLAKLPGQGLQHGCVLHVSDETQSFEVDLAIVNQVRA